MELKNIHVCVCVTEGQKLMEKFARPLHHLVFVKEPSQTQKLKLLGEVPKYDLYYSLPRVKTLWS